MKKKIHRIEDIAKLLLDSGISFNYEGTGYLKTTDKSYNVFDTLTYHVETKELIAMDDCFNKVEITAVLESLK